MREKDMRMCTPRKRNVLFALGAGAVIYSGSRAGWWREEIVGSLIRASVNKNSQFTNLDAYPRVYVHQRRGC